MNTLWTIAALVWLANAALWLDGRRMDRKLDALRLRRRMRTAVAVQNYPNN